MSHSPPPIDPRTEGLEDLEDEFRSVSGLYQAAGTALAQPDIDAAIKAAARRAVDSRPHDLGSIVPHRPPEVLPRKWRPPRWRAPLGIAASLILTVSLAFLGTRDRPDRFEPASEGDVRVPVTIASNPDFLPLPKSSAPANSLQPSRAGQPDRTPSQSARAELAPASRAKMLASTPTPTPTSTSTSKGAAVAQSVTASGAPSAPPKAEPNAANPPALAMAAPPAAPAALALEPKKAAPEVQFSARSAPANAGDSAAVRQNPASDLGTGFSAGLKSGAPEAPVAADVARAPPAPSPAPASPAPASASAPAPAAGATPAYPRAISRPVPAPVGEPGTSAANEEPTRSQLISKLKEALARADVQGARALWQQLHARFPDFKPDDDLVRALDAAGIQR